jgi:predicted transcriptional regulator
MPVSMKTRALARSGSVPVSTWQRQRLGAHDRARIMEAARKLERATYRRGSGLHGGYLRDTAIRVLWTLLYRGRGRVGACDPSLMQLAVEARMARSTVQAALERLEIAGVLSRIRRGLVVGHRYVQVTNVYWFRAVESWLSDTDCRQALDSKVEQRLGDKVAVEHERPQPIGTAEVKALAARWGLQGA